MNCVSRGLIICNRNIAPPRLLVGGSVQAVTTEPYQKPEGGGVHIVFEGGLLHETRLYHSNTLYII